ncbi:response regulator transcription factor [Leucobacter luti]|uniref:Sensory transduction protein RegX3 n=1 Tax=Leucobacter luti TaxID=340320 RepID=A0A4R6S9B3_9MICO|nr:response regulator transcription factor [Leucobacter luti]MCW2288847.1 two-component system response regulator RegX3 [Leucobacter luti]QYM75255.1 response regulator transcription factor [Leucobacter luti]TCK45002.1 two-component system response regulator RegX3 [Leucobacter luti]TDP95526.1 two-component system response regulator RegX3 [Leucobacter luti]
MAQHILLVEDEESISRPLAFLLEREGYRITVVDDGAEALTSFATVQPDLILLDLMLPSLPGTEVCRAIRLTSQVPIIMLTAKDSEIDIVVGLELGADDYITKPYSTRELLARVRAALRRSGSVEEERENLDAFVLDELGIRLDSERHSVTVRGEEIAMPLREFELLEMLMRHSGRVLTRGQLIDRVWGSNYYGDTKTLDVHVKRIRARIEEEASQPKLISTVRGVGYRFG